MIKSSEESGMDEADSDDSLPFLGTYEENSAKPSKVIYYFWSKDLHLSTRKQANKYYRLYRSAFI